MKKVLMGFVAISAVWIFSADAFSQAQPTVIIAPSGVTAISSPSTPPAASRAKKRNRKPTTAYVSYYDSKTGATTYLMPAHPAPFPLAQYVPNDTFYPTKGHVYSQYPQLDDLWGVKLLNMEKAWDFTKGSGVIVAVVDSGVYYNHNDLSGNIWANQVEVSGQPGVDDDGNGYIDDVRGWDFWDDDNDPNDPWSGVGHGTHVAGIIGAMGGNNRGIIGISPEVKIMPVRVLNDDGGGYWSDIALGIRYAANNGAKIINLSLGQQYMAPSDVAIVTSAIAYAKGKGAIVVAAAGNGDSNFIGVDISTVMPARLSTVITVGALRHPYDVYTGSGPLSRANFSNFGSQLDVMAPGVDILSLSNDTLNNGSSGYIGHDGTSMAAPMVSGVIALLLAQDPLATFDDIYRRLRYSSIDMGAAGFDTLYGYGRVDAFRALSYDYYSDGVVKIYRLALPDANGIIRYDYFYSTHIDTATLANGSVYRFYDVSQRIKSVLDPQGNLTEYFDDAYGSGGSGRVFRVLLANGTEYRYLAYWGNTNTPQTLANYTSGQLVSTQNFYGSGIFKSIGYPDGSLYTVYETSQRILSAHDAAGNTLEYYDDTFGSGGSGRYKGFLLPSGVEYRFTSYWGNTNTSKATEHYLSGQKIWSRGYYASGNLESHTDVATGNIYEFFDLSQNRKSTYEASTGTTYEHRDENWQGTKTGRYAKITSPDGSYQIRTEYWGDETPGNTADDTDHVHWVSFYNSSDQLLATIEYDPSGISTQEVFLISDTMTSQLEMYNQISAEKNDSAGEKSLTDKTRAFVRK